MATCGVNSISLHPSPVESNHSLGFISIESNHAPAFVPLMLKSFCILFLLHSTHDINIDCNHIHSTNNDTSWYRDDVGGEVVEAVSKIRLAKEMHQVMGLRHAIYKFK